MRICEVKYNCFNSKNVGFSGIDRSVLQKNTRWPFIKTVKHKNTSWMFRPGAEYCKKLYSYFSKVFKNKKKVNVYNYGCSLGYEAYSFIIGMRYIDNKNFAKFIPIIAKDYDEKIVQEAKTYSIPINYFYEITDMKNHFGVKDNSQYFDLNPIDSIIRHIITNIIAIIIKTILKMKDKTIHFLIFLSSFLAFIASTINEIIENKKRTTQNIQ